MEEDVFWLVQGHGDLSQLMTQALTSITKKYGNFVMCYVDDKMIATPTFAEHIDRLDESSTA